MSRASGDKGSSSRDARIVDEREVGREEVTTRRPERSRSVEPDRTPEPSRTPAQNFALVAGIVYLAIGIIGFFITGFNNFVGVDPEALLGFSINPLHNVVHILVGAVWLASQRKHDSAKAANTAIGVVYLALGVIGLLPLGNILDFLAINTADNWLHIVSGALSLFFGTKGAGDPYANKGGHTGDRRV
jgi:Domain of unknown function (DUF4383)